ncbi:MAG: GFA family protein [Paracoccaceae bacterium]
MVAATGRCLCGAVSVHIVPDMDELRACHCDMCRRWSGSAFLSIHVPDGSLTSDGPVRTYKSSDWAERAWCELCGSSLWYRLCTPGREFYGVAAGLFDKACGFALAKEFYIDRKPDGFAFAGEHKRLSEARMNEIIAAFVARGET